MKNKPNKQRHLNTRRNFIKSTGMCLAGIGVLRPSISAFGSIVNLNADVVLPDGVKAVWDISMAFHETTATRERICINGLWQWQPGVPQADQLPAGNWGYFKVPGNWPGLGNYMMKENQKCFSHPDWNENVANLDAAWYRREISIPAEWKDRRIMLTVDYLNSSALVFIDSKNAGELLFPSGELDITSMCTPGRKHVISMKVTSLPLQDVVARYNDSNSSGQAKAVVARKGLCGDVYLYSTPVKARIKDVRVVTSVRKRDIIIKVGSENLTAGAKYYLTAVITDNGNPAFSFKSWYFGVDEIKDGYISFSESWLPDKLWDTHTPGNMFDLSVSLWESNKILDTALPVHFGFREFWIDGRDFFLNGTRIYLSTVPFDNGQSGAALASYEGAKESMLRLKEFGINFVYTHNYGCEPGTHISFAEILRAADDTGMLFSLSLPHFGQYDWTAPDADKKNGYAHHAAFYVQAAQNHPSVVFYSMSHNGTGYTDDMNPDKIDGLSRPDSPWSQNNVKKALRCEAIATSLDPSRIVYHHSSGNLSSMHTSNFYPNWVPVQEMNDWFEHWATDGVKPVFLCEFGAPFTWDWAMYRGWYKGKREFGSARVPWEFCLAEWSAQFLGDRAYRISEMEKTNLRWEAERFRKGLVWGRSDYPFNFDNRALEERNPVFAMHIAENWRAFRTWGLSANSPWHHGPYFKLRDGVGNMRKDYKVDWETLQRPGLSADFISDRATRRDLDVGTDRSDWVPNEAGEALVKNNMALLAYIGGKPDAFTGKDHNFFPGSYLEKQLIVINNSREIIEYKFSWELKPPIPEIITAAGKMKLETGRQDLHLISNELPANLAPGNYELKAKVEFSTGEIQEDSLIINVLPLVSPPRLKSKIALFDPKGQTADLLERLFIDYQDIKEGADLSGYDIVIIGKEALTVDGSGLDLTNVREGLKVIVFEQTSVVLEKRFGFRVQEYGLRQVYKRIADHPALAGITDDNLRDWQGEATLLSPRLKYETNTNVFNGVPTVKWCDITVPRLWRCGNRGSVASVLIEKPACGNFLPVVDGGFSLQYSPLMEYREGKGLVVFCQLDVSGRTEDEPASERIAANLFSYVSGWRPGKNLQPLYAGDPAGKSHLEKAGISALSFESSKLSSRDILIIGPGSKEAITAKSAAIAKWIKSGGRLLAVGLGKEETNALPFKVTMKTDEHIAAYFNTLGMNSAFAGVGPSDVHNRSPKQMPLVSEGAEITGNGVLAENANAVFCQIVPWQCDYSNEQHNNKQTFRRSSFLLSRLMGNMNVESTTPLLARFNSPVDSGKAEKRWLDGLYLDQPEEWDDPYRFFRW